MMDTPANDHPRAFWRAAKDPAVFDEAVAAAVDVIHEVRPQVLVTYDENGDYGHPDHIMPHGVAMAAVDAAAREPAPWQIAKVYWTAVPRSVLRGGFDAMKEQASDFFGVDRFEELTIRVDDEAVTTVIDASRFGAAKMAALAQHATQITVDGPFFALSNNIGREVMGIEYFRLVRASRPASVTRTAARPTCSRGPTCSPGRHVSPEPARPRRVVRPPKPPGIPRSNKSGQCGRWRGQARGSVLCCVSAALAAVIAVLLTPFYLGSVIVPIAVLVAVASNVVLPLIARNLAGSTLAAALPLIVWIVVVVVLSLPRPEGDVLLPGGKGGQLAVSYGVVLTGVVAGMVTLTLSSPRRTAVVRREISSPSR